MASNVDVLIVFYNSSNFVGPLLNSLRAISIPVTAYFLDNGSRDGTAEKLAREIPNLSFRAFLFRTLTNQGFARGINVLSRQGEGDFIFILNPDAELETEVRGQLKHVKGGTAQWDVEYARVLDQVRRRKGLA